VLEFYRTAPFNASESPAAMATQIRAHNAALAYPPLDELLLPGQRVLDAGCGTGWLTNSIAYHCGCTAVGIDFNPTAIEFAQATAQALDVPSTFEVADLFLWEPASCFQVVVSLGVLHHTDDCEAGLRHLFCNALCPGGSALIGLYHSYGRRPFLEHFATMKSAGASEEQMLDRFRALFGPQKIDETHCRSWFRDQVLHPHETQHSLKELMPIIQGCSLELVSTSLNDFQPISKVQEILDAEPTWEDVARERLASNRYFPGFFVFLARKRH